MFIFHCSEVFINQQCSLMEVSHTLFFVWIEYIDTLISFIAPKKKVLSSGWKAFSEPSKIAHIEESISDINDKLQRVFNLIGGGYGPPYVPSGGGAGTTHTSSGATLTPSAGTPVVLGSSLGVQTMPVTCGYR